MQNKARIMSKKRPQITKAIKEIFAEKEQVVLSDIYKTLSENQSVVDAIKQNELKHRTRSCIHSLVKSGHIVRVAESTYKVAR